MGSLTDAWQELDRELDAWAAEGRCATLWWRDDDCVEPSAALDRLLGMAERHAAPLALAVVPARMSSRLPARLAAWGSGISVLQHGYAHRNHAPASEKSRELGPDRPKIVMLEELSRGAARLIGSLPKHRQMAVLVPPWNRIDPDLIPSLGELGFVGLSTDGPRSAAEAAPGLAQTNTHLDLLRTARKGRTFDPAAAIGDLIAHLSARRRGEADAEEPSGILSHHLAHEEPAWELLEALLTRLGGHRGARFQQAHEIFMAGSGTTA